MAEALPWADDVQRYASGIVLGGAPEFSTCATSLGHYLLF